MQEACNKEEGNRKRAEDEDVVQTVLVSFDELQTIHSCLGLGFP